MSYGPSGYAGGSTYAGGAGTGYSRFASTYSGGAYASSGSLAGYGMSTLQPTYIQPEQANHSSVEVFLNPTRPQTPFVSQMDEVKEIVEQTYRIITEQEFPHDSIKLMICDEEKLKSIHASTGGVWSNGIMGFSFNKYGKGVSEIYVRQEHMDQLLLTIGHEIGHVLGPTLLNAKDEEAKAHAFSLAWMETIRENDIAGLQPNIMPNPAKNGLHDVSFNFVQYLLQTGATSYDIFTTLAHGLTSIVAEN